MTSVSVNGEAMPYPPAGAQTPGSRFSEVWKLLLAEPYAQLPTKRLRWRDALHFLPTRLLRAGQRTLNDARDVLPRFDKLVHPLGIALRGVWSITESTPYDGYFAQGSQGLLIARASDALGEYRSGKLRFMGMAGKLYPTMDELHRAPLHTANFFVMENVAGSHTQHFAHATYHSNLLPPIPHVGAAAKGPLGGVAAAAFTLADKSLDPSRPGIRQLYPIAELGHGQSARAPAYMRLVGDDHNPRVDEADLRNELARALEGDGELRFWIEVADGWRYLPKSWRRIGHVRFSEAVASDAADHRLHFTHPKYRR